MADFEHRQGPEHGRLYSTPEEALESEPVMALSAEDLREQAQIPAVRERLERVRRMSESRVNFMKQVSPNLWVIDIHSARRAVLHVVEDTESLC
jgi:hypothetical protein